VALQSMVERDRERLMAERNRLEQELEQRTASKHEGISWIIGKSRAIQEVTEKVQLVRAAICRCCCAVSREPARSCLRARSMSTLRARSSRIFA